MADRELLEAAAKAAGFDIKSLWTVERGFVKNAWNPLTDDGDALRLAVALKIPLQFPDWQDIARTWGPEDQSEGFIEPALHHNGDLGVATRRAIVRAAASIGSSGEREGER